MAETYTEKINSEEFFLPEYGHRYLPADCADDFSDEGSTGAGVAKYFQRIGLHALLSRKDEVKIAKRIETAEHQILRMLLQTSIAVEHIVDLGTKIKAGELKAKRVSRALRTGDTCNDGAAQIVKFLDDHTYRGHECKKQCSSRKTAFCIDPRREAAYLRVRCPGSGQNL